MFLGSYRVNIYPYIGIPYIGLKMCSAPAKRGEWVSESAGDAARSHNLALHIYSPTDSLALQEQLSIIFDEGIIKYLNICSAYSMHNLFNLPYIQV